METKVKSGIYPLAMTGVMAAVLAVVAPFALPIGPISLSLCTLIIYLTAYVLGWKRGTLAILVYVLLGVVGMPVFTGFQGGLGKVMGPTGGYILGYLPLILLSGLAVSRFPRNRALQLLGMAAATAVLYAFGTAWYCLQSGNPLDVALGFCVFPFIPGDLIKIAIAMVLGPILRRRLLQAGLHPEG